MLPHTRKHARTRRRTHTVSNILLALHQLHHNIIIINITISISAGSAAFVIVIVIVPHCCCYCFSCCRQPTNAHKHTRTSLFYITGTKCLSLFPHKLHSTIFSIFFTLRTLARFQIFLFLFSLRVDCAIRAITLTLRSEVTALSLAVSTQRSSAHL